MPSSGRGIYNGSAFSESSRVHTTAILFEQHQGKQPSKQASEQSVYRNANQISNLLVPLLVMCGTQHVRYLHCKHTRHVPDFCQQPPKTYYPLLKTVAVHPCHDWKGKAPPVPVVWMWENFCRECILEKKIMRILSCVPDYFDQPGSGAALCKEYGLAL